MDRPTLDNLILRVFGRLGIWAGALTVLPVGSATPEPSTLDPHGSPEASPGVSELPISQYRRKFIAHAKVRITRLGEFLGHRSHSSHSSHRSHSSHSSHSSHYSSSPPSHFSSPPPPPAAKSAPPPAKAPIRTFAAPPAEAPEAVLGLSEDFEDGRMDPAKWTLGAMTRGAPSEHVGMRVVETKGQLRIAYAGGTTPCFSGYVSARQWSIRDRVASVQVPQTLDADGATSFALVRNEANWYGFRVSGGKLSFISVVEGVVNGDEVAFDPSLQRYWRMRHSADAGVIIWETSRDGAGWEVQHATAPGAGTEGLFVELGAGSQGTSAPHGVAVFDDLYLGPSR